MNNLHWILEPATRPMDEEGRIYEEVIGKSPNYFVAIYEGAEKTEDGYRNVPMICVKHQGERDYVSKVLTDELRARFPRATKWWDDRRNVPPKASIRLLPGITPAEVMELEDLQIPDVETLCEAQVPERLDRWKGLALRFRSLAKPRIRLEAAA